MTLELVPGGWVDVADPRRCEFALCRQEAEYSVEMSSATDDPPVRVCSLHVTPVVVWGRPDGDRGAVIRDLGPRSQQAG